MGRQLVVLTCLLAVVTGFAWWNRPVIYDPGGPPLISEDEDCIDSDGLSKITQSGRTLIEVNPDSSRGPTRAEVLEMLGPPSWSGAHEACWKVRIGHTHACMRGRIDTRLFIWFNPNTGRVTSTLTLNEKRWQELLVDLEHDRIPEPWIGDGGNY